MIIGMNLWTGTSPIGGHGTGQAENSPPKPATVHESVSQPLNTAQLAVTQLPASGQADWQQVVDPDGQQKMAQGVGGSPDGQSLGDAIQRINQHLKSYNTSLHFEVEENYGQPVIRVVDQGRDEVVRQIPTETAVALGQFFDDMAILKSRQAVGSADGVSTKGFLLQKMT